MSLTKEQKKALTEFLGECWHEYGIDSEGYESSCIKCHTWRCQQERRAFTSESDMMALYRRLHEVKKWKEFYLWAVKKSTYEIYEGFELYDYEMSAYLFCLSRTGYEEWCGMCAEFLKEG
jgi:hypothetical protein